MLYAFQGARLTANPTTLETRQTATAVGGVGARSVACSFVAADRARTGLSVWTAAHIPNVTVLDLHTCTASTTAHVRRADRGAAQRAFGTLELPLHQHISDAHPFEPLVSGIWSDRRLHLVCPVPEARVL